MTCLYTFVRIHHAHRAIFSFYQYGDHRDLHSFPTRRSSDLLDRSCFSYQVAAGSTTSEKSVVEVCRKSRVSSRSSLDRKSTRLNSSHVSISYAVFCLKKKKQ